MVTWKNRSKTRWIVPFIVKIRESRIFIISKKSTLRTSTVLADITKDCFVVTVWYYNVLVNNQSNNQGPVAWSLVSTNHWLRGIKTCRFLWYFQSSYVTHDQYPQDSNEHLNSSLALVRFEWNLEDFSEICQEKCTIGTQIWILSSNFKTTGHAWHSLTVMLVSTWFKQPGLGCLHHSLATNTALKNSRYMYNSHDHSLKNDITLLKRQSTTVLLSTKLTQTIQLNSLLCMDCTTWLKLNHEQRVNRKDEIIKHKKARAKLPRRLAMQKRNKLFHGGTSFDLHTPLLWHTYWHAVFLEHEENGMKSNRENQGHVEIWGTNKINVLIFKYEIERSDPCTKLDNLSNCLKWL